MNTYFMKYAYRYVVVLHWNVFRYVVVFSVDCI